MEVPPGRLEASKAGGRGALISLISEAERRRLNGLLVIRRLRDDVPVEGVIVFQQGTGSLASHAGREIVDGPRALKAILGDALSEEASLELRSYDYRGSSIRIDQLASSHPEARIDAMPDLAAMLSQIEAEERDGRRARRPSKPLSGGGGRKGSAGGTCSRPPGRRWTGSFRPAGTSPPRETP